MDFSVLIIILGCILGVLFLCMRNLLLNKLNQYLKNKKYDSILQLTSKPWLKFVIGKYNVYLYHLRALFLNQNIDKFKEELHALLEAHANEWNVKVILETYYHYFLNGNDLDYAKELLAYIKKTQDIAYIRYNQWAYDVIVAGTNDLINEMDTAIQEKAVNGFGLGVVLYLVALQHERLQHYEEARSYYYTAIECFLSSAYYVPICENKVKELNLLIQNSES